MDRIYRSVWLFDFFPSTHFIHRGFVEKKGCPHFPSETFQRERTCAANRPASALQYRILPPSSKNIEKRTLGKSHTSIYRKTFFQPENVVCTQKDNTTVKIIDFGTAKELEPGTAIKVLCGTPEFVAPEVIFVQIVRFLKQLHLSGGQIRLHIHRIG